MRDLLNILNENHEIVTESEGQYLLATYNLETKAWRVTFYPSRAEAHVAYKQWSSAFTGDAYICPVERKYHADAASRSAAVNPEKN